MIKSRMPGLVKGAGYAGNRQRPLEYPTEIMLKAQQATLDLRTETARGDTSRAEVTKGLNQGFLSQFGYLKTALTTPTIGEQADRGVRPGWSLLTCRGASLQGNLGIARSTAPGAVRPPARRRGSIYPAYTVYRNKLPWPRWRRAPRCRSAVFTGRFRLADPWSGRPGHLGFH